MANLPKTFFLHKSLENTPAFSRFFCGVLLVFLAIPLLSKAPLAQTMVYGPVTHIRDGDTIKIGPVVVRLEGVSAPELKEKMGKKAKLFMRNLVLNKKLTCRLNGKKTYDRFVGTCLLRGKDIGTIIISNGLALDCPRYSAGRYQGYETLSAKKYILLPKYCLLKKR